MRSGQSSTPWVYYSFSILLGDSSSISEQLNQLYCTFARWHLHHWKMYARLWHDSKKKFWLTKISARFRLYVSTCDSKFNVTGGGYSKKKKEWKWFNDYLTVDKKIVLNVFAYLKRYGNYDIPHDHIVLKFSHIKKAYADFTVILPFKYNIDISKSTKNTKFHQYWQK